MAEIRLVPGGGCALEPEEVASGKRARVVHDAGGGGGSAAGGTGLSTAAIGTHPCSEEGEQRCALAAGTDQGSVACAIGSKGCGDAALRPSGAQLLADALGPKGTPRPWEQRPCCLELPRPVSILKHAPRARRPRAVLFAPQLVMGPQPGYARQG